MLIPVQWDGNDLNVVDDGNGCQRMVTTLDGWDGAPDVVPGDEDRVLMDGAVLGPKVLKAREVVITGAAIGSRGGLVAYRNLLAQLTVGLSPADLTVTDPYLGGTLTASVRAITGLTQAWKSNAYFTFQVTVRSGDPRKYEAAWRQATLSLGGTGPGRAYPRHYATGWAYGGQLPGQAQLTNAGNAAAPVYALYTGPLSDTRLASGTDFIHIAALQAGEQLTVDTSTLMAYAPGGATRAGYVLPGSVPMLVPPASAPVWSIQGTGTGSVQLNWRSAYT
jgi:hypothetical protein